MFALGRDRGKSIFRIARVAFVKKIDVVFLQAMTYHMGIVGIPDKQPVSNPIVYLIYYLTYIVNMAT
jgi:hypothetical protein